MVQDIRRITLSTEELVQALNAHRSVAENFLPAGTIVGFEIANATSIDVIIVADRSSDNRRVNVPDC